MVFFSPSGNFDLDQICDGYDLDDDNDGVLDDDDVFPLDPSETLDSDSDGVGDNSDPYKNIPYMYHPIILGQNIYDVPHSNLRFKVCNNWRHS